MTGLQRLNSMEWYEPEVILIALLPPGSTLYLLLSLVRGHSNVVLAEKTKLVLV